MIKKVELQEVNHHLKMETCLSKMENQQIARNIIGKDRMGMKMSTDTNTEETEQKMMMEKAQGADIEAKTKMNLKAPEPSRRGK